MYRQDHKLLMSIDSNCAYPSQSHAGGSDRFRNHWQRASDRGAEHVCHEDRRYRGHRGADRINWPRPGRAWCASRSISKRDCQALAEIRRRTQANLSVDLQENYRLAADVAPWVDKIRYNPGHLYHHERKNLGRTKCGFWSTSPDSMIAPCGWA